jgi:tryptophanyl-tRNA synthetase
MATARKPTALSGIQPTGRLHLGNYLGALQNFVTLQNSNRYACFFMLADLHSLTEPYEPKEKTQQTLELAAAYLAAGLDPKRSTIFLQSLVPEHSELAWIFSTITPLGELERMTQYKDKVSRQPEHTNVGLLTYPVLMAVDILLYKPVAVPVGDDQVQHLELTRTIARAFNRRFGKTFPEPKALHTPVPRLMSLTDPTRKMSKSEPAGCLFLDDPPAVIEHKVRRAVTDTAPAGEMSPGVQNLFLLLRSFSDVRTVQRFEAAHATGTIRYSELKEALGRDIAKALAPFQKRYAALAARPATLRRTLTTGAARARQTAGASAAEVREKIGLLIP